MLSQGAAREVRKEPEQTAGGGEEADRNSKRQEARGG